MAHGIHELLADDSEKKKHRGEKVEAWHRTGGWHEATIHELLADGSVKV
jgi:hypothetical protein